MKTHTGREAGLPAEHVRLFERRNGVELHRPTIAQTESLSVETFLARVARDKRGCAPLLVYDERDIQFSTSLVRLSAFEENDQEDPLSEPFDVGAFDPRASLERIAQHITQVYL